MSEKSKISWTDSTINFWSGCTKVSPGCANCYAEARDKRHMIEDVDHWSKGAPRLKGKGAVKDALALNRKPWICEACGEGFPNREQHECPTISDVMAFPDEVNWHRRRIFSLSLGDFLDHEAPIEWLAEMLDTIRQCDQVIWILCTKRPEIFFSRLGEVMMKYCKVKALATGEPTDILWHWLAQWSNGRNIPSNIIILTSAENQEQANKRVPELLKIPTVCRGLSVEPMLGPIRFPLHWFSIPIGDGPEETEGIRWVIFGGESGKDARPCNVDWIRDGVKQCQAAGMAAFVKQLGANAVYTAANLNLHPSAISDPRYWVRLHGSTHHSNPLKHPKGGDPAEWPEDLRIQQFPKL